MKKILIIILILILPIVALATTLFSDGFESGDLTAWTDNSNDGGDLSAHADAALHGSYGAKFLIDDTTGMNCRDATPSNETRYRFRFYFDPNTLGTANGDYFSICAPYTAGWAVVGQVFFATSATDYQIYISVDKDAGATISSAYNITDEPHCIEVDWMAATGVGEDDGYMTLWIDGVSKETLSGVDNDTKSVGMCFFGPNNGVPADITGEFYMDDFVSNDDGSEIGVILEEDNAVFFGTNF